MRSFLFIVLYASSFLECKDIGKCKKDRRKLCVAVPTKLPIEDTNTILKSFCYYQIQSQDISTGYQALGDLEPQRTSQATSSTAMLGTRIGMFAPIIRGNAGKILHTPLSSGGI
jgi:hypothetical protein